MPARDPSRGDRKGMDRRWQCRAERLLICTATSVIAHNVDATGDALTTEIGSRFRDRGIVGSVPMTSIRGVIALTGHRTRHGRQQFPRRMRHSRSRTRHVDVLVPEVVTETDSFGIAAQ
jgi:hypothetical protein